MSRPALPELVLCQDMLGGSRARGNSGGGQFDVVSEKGGFFLSAPNFANNYSVDDSHRLRGLALPLAEWQHVLDEAAGSSVSLDWPHLYRGAFHSETIQSALRNLWRLCDEEGVPSRLLARAAGCEIMAELCRLGGAPLRQRTGGLAPWAERRCLEMMHARFSEDISLDALSAEAKLSPFHFARMFKHSLGVPPRVYVTQLRIRKASEFLENTDLSIMEIALEVGYSSSQVLARVFLKHRRMSPSAYRQAIRSSGPTARHCHDISQGM